MYNRTDHHTINTLTFSMLIFLYEVFIQMRTIWFEDKKKWMFYYLLKTLFQITRFIEQIVLDEFLLLNRYDTLHILQRK